ncbi:hypothetical protein [Mesoterricola silvestris]|uniref:Ig-like domain-containing protein n=1 Tax=Mesoterricola silvestris TaxID=2927979 RepID=A0AA48KAQ0_9BACT|nr:hypothetical protein [Mesoterricola silvestris]BDU73537.1 hypothetical protein METEAL_27110 [Mesoterricola silvestris]
MAHSTLLIPACLLLALGCVEPRAVAPVSPMAPSPLVVEPGSLAVTTGQGADFKARARDGSRPAVTWEAQGGSIDASGHFTAGDEPATATVVARAYGGRTASAAVKVVAPPRGTVTAPRTVWTGARGVKASVPAQEGATYAWKVEGGTLRGDGRGPSVLFDAGSDSKAVLSCRVVNAAGLGLTASLELPLVPGVALSVDPASATVTAGASLKFGFSLEGGTSGEVKWSVREAGGGAVDATGRYRAPAKPGAYTVLVVSKDDPSIKAAVPVKVVAAPAGAVKGPGKVVPGARALRASVPEQAGCRYAWKITGGTLTSGADAPQVTFDAGEGPKLDLVCEITNEAGDSLKATLTVPVG